MKQDFEPCKNCPGRPSAAGIYEYLEIPLEQYNKIWRQGLGADAGGLMPSRLPLKEIRQARRSSKEQATHAPIGDALMPDGSLSHNAEDIARVFLSHFASLLMSEQQYAVFDVSDTAKALFDHMASPDKIRSMLCYPVSRGEVHAVLTRTSKGTAPGTEDILTAFRSAFSCLGDSLTAVASVFFVEGLEPVFFSRPYVLVLKPGMQPSALKSLRPITLLNTDYKLIGTIITQCIRYCVTTMVALFRVALFLVNIFTSLTLTRDTFACVASKGISGAFFPSDQSKAFDIVEHDYLFIVFRCSGLPGIFIDILRALYAGLFSQLSVHGLICGHFTVTQCVRQGGPLPPALFVLSLDNLLRAVECNS